jgi:hypothetical protein
MPKTKTKQKGASKKASQRIERTQEPTPPEVRTAINNVGQALIKHLIDEFAANKKAWDTMAPSDRDILVERVGRRIRHEIRLGYANILAYGQPALTAKLAKVVFGPTNVQGTLTIDTHTPARHTLADFVGADVVVVLANDVEELLRDMDDLIETSNQQLLPLAGGTVCPTCKGEMGQYVHDPDTTSGTRWVDCPTCTA